MTNNDTLMMNLTSTQLPTDDNIYDLNGITYYNIKG